MGEREYHQLVRKPFMEIGWLVKENIIVFDVLTSYTLKDGKDITFEIVGFMASKTSSKLIVKMDVPIIFNTETLDYIIYETFPFLHEVGMKSIAYIHYDATSYRPFAEMVKEKFKFNVSVFGNISDALAWLEKFD